MIQHSSAESGIVRKAVEPHFKKIMADFWEEICQACSTGDLATFSAILESGSCFHNINLLKEGDHLGRYSEDPLRRSDVDRLVQLITLACNEKQPQPNILRYLFSYSSVMEYIGRGMPALPRIAIRSGSPEIVRLFLRADNTMVICGSALSAQRPCVCSAP